MVNYRAIWKANKKPEIKLIKKQIKFFSSYWGTYTTLCRLCKSGQIDKAIKHVENWPHKPTAEIAGKLLEKILNAAENEKVIIETHSTKIPVKVTFASKEENEKVMAGARLAPVGNVQNQRQKDQAAIDKAMKRAAQVEKEVREKYGGTENQDGSTDFDNVDKAVGYLHESADKKELNEKAKESPVLSKYEKELVQEPDKIVIEAVQEAKSAQVVKADIEKEIEEKEQEEEKIEKEEHKEIPKSEWSNVFNDLMRKYMDDQPAVTREIHGYYTKSLDEHYLTEDDYKQLIANINYSKENLINITVDKKPQEEYIADLETIQQIFSQKLETQPDATPQRPLRTSTRQTQME